MSLKKCNDCGREISKRARTCPNCGAPNPIHIPTGIGALILCAIVFGPILIAVMSGPGNSQAQNRDRLTSLSEKASQLKHGMTKPVVIRLLGKPTWAVIPSDKGEFALPDPSIELELRWQNPGCAPVAVMFDHNLEVTGWDEGRLCKYGSKAFEPSKDYLCEKNDRAKYCK